MYVKLVMLSDILNSGLDPKLGNRIIVFILRGQTLNIEIKVLFFYTAVKTYLLSFNLAIYLL